MDPDVVAAIAQVTAGKKINISRFCRDHNMSRTTFHKYVARFEHEGAAGFTRRSTAPRTRPTTTPERVQEAVIRCRKELDDEGRDNGPISIMWRLEDTHCDPVPSRATIYRILRDRGQIVAQPQKKPKPRRRFEFADPNGCWQIDGMDFYLANGELVCILQIIDDHSRIDACCYAARSENGDAAWRAMQHAFAGYGLPVCALSDNSTAFSGRHHGGGMAALERHLAGLGITTIASSVAHPQTCGKTERAHRTLRKWLRKQPAPETLEQLQDLLDAYRLMYNNRRHQGIGGQTPQQRWDATEKATPPARHHPRSGTVARPVSATGVVQFDGCSIILGKRYANTQATLYWQDKRVAVMIGEVHVRTLVLDHTVRYQRITPPAPHTPPEDKDLGSSTRADPVVTEAEVKVESPQRSEENRP